LTKQMQQLSINYANLYSAMRNNNGGNSRRRNQVSFNNSNRGERNNQRRNDRSDGRGCYNCGREGHLARNCPDRFNGQVRNNNNFRVNLMDSEYLEEYYYSSDEEYDNDECYEAETYLNTRKGPKGPYPANVVSKNKRGRKPKSESLQEELLRVPEPQNEQMETIPIPPVESSRPKKSQRKMLPAPIEKLDEFNVASYLQDLPCGLSVGQAAHSIPRYRSGLVRALRRTRERETNYVEQYSDEDQHTAAKCDMYVGDEPITVVVDSGATTSIITSSLLEQLGYKSSRSSKVVIVTANGTREKAVGRVDNLPVNVQNVYIQSPVHIIKSKDNVLILGNDWLK
jgi:hypothetical protein